MNETTSPKPAVKKDSGGETLAIKRIIEGRTAKILYATGIICSLFHLWVNTIGIMPEIQRNAVHYSFMLFIGFLQYPLLKKHARETLPIDYFLAILSFAVGLYLVFFEDALHMRNEVPIMVDLIAAGLAIVLLMEITRRTTGLLIPVLAIIFLTYGLGGGRYLDGLWHFPGVTMPRMLYRMYFAPDGIFGTIATISSTFVFLFVLFASFLIKSGAGDFIIKLAMATMGRTIGGPAKMAVFASGFMGSISGSAVANTVGTGSITIPMMKKTGFPSKFAGAVEAAASTGGQLMPPIMGAGAFIMSQWTQIPYLTIVAVAFIPAIMYFVSVAFFVHLRAKKLGIKPVPEEDIPKIKDVLKEGWNFFIPIGILMGLLMIGYTPTFAACGGILGIIAASWLNPKTRMSGKDILDALAGGGINMVTTGVILLCSGIVVGVVLMVGMGIKFSMLITMLAGDSLLLTILMVAIASLILGMGLPVTASYIVLAVLAAPAMQMLGTSLIAAHMLIFWYSQDANVTPPVCLAAYSASGISGSKPLETGFESWKIAKGLYIIPLLFCYTPILFEGPMWQVVETVVTATAGLFCFAVFFEGFNTYSLNIAQRMLYMGTAGLLLWPDMRLHAAGLALLTVMFLRERSVFRKQVFEAV